MEQAAADGEMIGKLYKAIYENKWSAAKVIIDAHPSCLNAQLSAITGETALHVAAKFSHVGIVEELLRLVPPEYLEILDARGFTPLMTASTYRGLIPIAKCLIQKHSNALEIPVAGSSWLPVALAFRCGHDKMGCYLYSRTPLRVLKPENGLLSGATLLSACLSSGNLDIALDLLRRCTELLFAPDYAGTRVIRRIAGFVPKYSLNTSQHWCWQRWIYHYTKIPTTATEHSCVDTEQESESNKARGLNLLHLLISHIYNLSGMKEMYKKKLQHTQSDEILNFVCEKLKFLDQDKETHITEALHTAARNGQAEFLLRALKSNPVLITLATLPDPNGNIFFSGISFRQNEIFNLLHGFRFKDNVVSLISASSSNTFLHEVAMLAPASRLNSISGAALQLQREMQWFKAAESVVAPGYSLFRNCDWLTPLECLKINHKELRNEGEKWMKDTASSCSVVGALIITIMFTAAFTVPGGNDQTSGYPIFLQEKLFKVFLISDALSLFASTTSVLTFLGILTSRYAEEDFLYSLPKKLIIGLSTLFLSIATMLIAFSATIIILLEHNSSRLGAFLPVIMLASVPITLFVLLQFPLLVEIISSTYGRGILNKKVSKWP
ncbi:uncharacterized protein LOC129307795 [Prosopis cineraria]|uniref:uncharacterized protein LOC129307795 n=1 Tax=Prosopis cineraria TaxID=364024 RepID=UPI00240F2920|nr:uncharacterized protein LOC129307795 [Prosopis cineraria]